MDVQEVLKNCTVEGNVVKLPEGQLERKLYQEVNKALTLIGGKWVGRKVMGFIFQEDPTELLKQIAGGEKRNLKKEFQFFATPEALADYLAELAELEEGHEILEPSAGQGAIISAINAHLVDTKVDCYELMDLNRTFLEKINNANILGDDFFKHKGKQYDRIIANPPFSKNQDIDHVRAMYACLKIGGRMVSIMSESWVEGSQKKQKEFREWLNSLDSEILDIDRGAFKESGTMVGGKIVVINA